MGNADHKTRCTIPTTAARSNRTMCRNVSSSAFSTNCPFGPRKPHLSKGLLSEIVGNWQFSGITVFQSGIPLRIAASDTTGLLDFALNVGRANRSKDPVLSGSERTTDRWFDTSAFSIAPAYTMPNDSLTQPRLRDPGRRNFDISLFRNQRIGERVTAQFRAEFYNMFNTPALSLGNTSSVTVNAPQFGKISDRHEPAQHSVRAPHSLLTDAPQEMGSGLPSSP